MFFICLFVSCSFQWRPGTHQFISDSWTSFHNIMAALRSVTTYTHTQTNLLSHLKTVNLNKWHRKLKYLELKKWAFHQWKYASTHIFITCYCVLSQQLKQEHEPNCFASIEIIETSGIFYSMLSFDEATIFRVRQNCNNMVWWYNGSIEPLARLVYIDWYYVRVEFALDRILIWNVSLIICGHFFSFHLESNSCSLRLSICGEFFLIWFRVWAIH